MIDPVPVGYVEFDQAVLRRTADISDRDYPERMREFREHMRCLKKLRNEDDAGEQCQSEDETKLPNMARLAWGKREFAINDIYAALCDESLLAVVRDPVSGEMFKLTTSDWRGAAFWRDIIVSGIVRSSVCEEIKRHDERRVLLKADEFDAWLTKLARCRPKPAETACGEWLEAAMRESPERRPKPKPEMREDAKAKFGVSGRMFDRIWDDKREITGANWGEPGAPPKLAR